MFLNLDTYRRNISKCTSLSVECTNILLPIHFVSFAWHFNVSAWWQLHRSQTSLGHGVAALACSITGGPCVPLILNQRCTTPLAARLQVFELQNKKQSCSYSRVLFFSAGGSLIIFGPFFSRLTYSSQEFVRMIYCRMLPQKNISRTGWHYICTGPSVDVGDPPGAHAGSQWNAGAASDERRCFDMSCTFRVFTCVIPFVDEACYVSWHRDFGGLHKDREDRLLRALRFCGQWLLLCCSVGMEGIWPSLTGMRDPSFFQTHCFVCLVVML